MTQFLLVWMCCTVGPANGLLLDLGDIDVEAAAVSFNQVPQPLSAVNTISFGTTGLTPSTATSGAVTVAGTLAIANGGTNSTATATSGGVGYGTGTAHAYTAAGTTGQVLTSNGISAPTWAASSGGTSIGLVRAISVNCIFP